MTYTEALTLAHKTYSGVYAVESAGDGFWMVRIHSPSGPIKWITPSGRIGTSDELNLPK